MKSRRLFFGLEKEVRPRKYEAVESVPVFIEVRAPEAVFQYPKYSVDAPPGKIDRRVFIGGDYMLMPILREIKKVVIESGYQPILASDFDMPKDRTRELSFRLLMQCKFAIFELTLSAGQISEMEKALTFPEIRVLPVFMAQDEERIPPRELSVMITQINPQPQGYITIDELKQKVREFLGMPVP